MWACDPSGGIKVMGQKKLISPDRLLAVLYIPVGPNINCFQCLQRLLYLDISLVSIAP